MNDIDSYLTNKIFLLKLQWFYLLFWSAGLDFPFNNLQLETHVLVE